MRTHFAPELTGLTPTRRTDVAAVVTSLTGFEAWDLLRHDLARSHRRIHQAWTTALTALLDPTGPTKATRSTERKSR